MDEVEVRELRYFIAVAEELNFTRAARRLGMAQPPLSAAVAKLERKLGTRLLERDSRRVSLTPAGAVLLDQGRIAVEAVSAAVERARRTTSQPRPLVVAVKAGSSTPLLKKIIQRCAREPGMPRIDILFGHPGGPAAAVRRGIADMAILRGPFDQRGLDTEVLLTEPRVALLPSGHSLARRRCVHRADLAGEPMPRWTGHADPATVAYWTGTDAPRASHPAAPSPQSVETRRGAAAPPTGPEISDIHQLIDLVALGQAVAYVPASIANQHASTDLAFLPVSDLSPSQVVAVWPEHSRSLRVACFVRTAADAVADLLDRAAAHGGPDHHTG
jgi:DNA-binding transcriptional LysR family regulator